jgi:hypothetical protein
MRRALFTTATVLVLAAMMLTLPAAAEVTMNERFPVRLLTHNPCNQEIVVLSGELHLLATVTEDAAGGTHTVFRIQEKATGTGTQTGATYQFVWSSQVTSTSQTPPPSEITFTSQQQVIG